jgi:hypothetical protein
VQAVLGRGDDPRLVRATEGVRLLPPVAGCGPRRAVVGMRRRTAGGEGPGDAGERDSPAQQAAPAEPRALVAGQDSTTAVSRDSGSDRAFTAFENSLTCSGVSWS